MVEPKKSSGELQSNDRPEASIHHTTVMNPLNIRNNIPYNDPKMASTKVASHASLAKIHGLAPNWLATNFNLQETAACQTVKAGVNGVASNVRVESFIEKVTVIVSCCCFSVRFWTRKMWFPSRSDKRAT